MLQDDSDSEYITVAVPSTSTDGDFFDIANVDDESIDTEDLTKLTSYVLSHSTRLELIATEFEEVFNMRCQLAVGTALIHIRDILIAMGRKETHEFLICRIICLYLIYRVRDIEPWLKRRTGGNEKIVGHIFFEFFFNLVDDSENGIVHGLASHSVEKKLAKLFLVGCPKEINGMTAEALYTHLSKASLAEFDSASYYDLIQEFKSKCEHWPMDENAVDIAYPHILYSLKQSTSEQSPEEVLQILVKLQDNVIEDGSSSIFTKPMKCVPMGMEIWSKSKRTLNEGLGTSQINSGTSENSMPDAACAVPNPNICSNDSCSDSHKTKSEQSDLNSFIFTIIPNIMKGEPLPSGHLGLAYECIKDMEDDHPFFVKIADFPPLAVNTYIEQHTKFSSELLYRIVKNDNDKVYLFLLAMMEMGFSVQCVEIVLRLYRSIPNLPTDILLEYCNTLMNICDATTSSSQKARYVRMFSSFVITILNDGLLQEQITGNTKSCFHQIQAFALRNNEYKEATGLYQKIQEVLRKGST